MKTHTLGFIHAAAFNTQAHRGQRFSHMESGLSGIIQTVETLSHDTTGCPGLVHTDTRNSALPPGSSPPPPNVFPVGLETNMAAFVYFLIGMPTSWIMSATAAAPGHSLHKQQLEMQNLGHCLGDFL